MDIYAVKSNFFFNKNVIKKPRRRQLKHSKNLTVSSGETNLYLDNKLKFDRKEIKSGKTQKNQ